MHPAENYQLKFQQHGIHLNSAIATLYRNEKFADVVLFSSNSNSVGGSSAGAAMDNGMPAVGISAHKFILGACSQFFAAMFEAAPIAAPNGVYYIVLPPDLSYRAIQILVQYIYTGEATVPNDVLNEVLRGGEILKIRGLYRAPIQHEVSNSGNGAANSAGSAYHPRMSHLLAQTSALSQPAASSQALNQVSVSTQLSGQPSTEVYVGSSASRSIPSANINSSRYSIEFPHSSAHSHPSLQYSQSHLRSLGASVLPKDSPVIVKSPKLSQMPSLMPTRTHQHQSHIHPKHRPGSAGGGASSGGITVNKEFGIDPEVKCCYQPLHHDTLPSTSSMAATSNAASLCTEMGCTSCGMLDPENAIVNHDRDRERLASQPEEIVTRCGGGVEHMDREYRERPILSLAHDHERDEPSSLDYRHRIRRASGTERNARDYFMGESVNYEQPHSSVASVTSTKSYALEHSSEAATNKGLQSPPPSYPHTFLSIKQEPADWSVAQPAPAHEGNADLLNRPISPTNLSLGSPKQPLDFKMPLGGASIKLEVQSSHSTDEDEPAAPPVQSLLQSTPRLLANSTEATEYSNEGPRKRYEVSTTKQWLNRSKIHATSTTAGNNNPPSNNIASSSTTHSTTSASGNGLTKSYVPKKKRRVSQQENTMDHVPLHCDICSTIFDTPADWVRHMNNQHTEVELAMFNSRKEHEKNENASASVSVCPAPSSNNYQLNHHHHHQQQNHHHHHHHHHNNKKYNSSSRSTLSTAHNNLPMHNSNSTGTKRNSSQTITTTSSAVSNASIVISSNINNDISNTNHSSMSNIIDNTNITATISPASRNIVQNDALDAASSPSPS